MDTKVDLDTEKTKVLKKIIDEVSTWKKPIDQKQQNYQSNILLIAIVILCSSNKNVLQCEGKKIIDLINGDTAKTQIYDEICKELSKDIGECSYFKSEEFTKLAMEYCGEADRLNKK